MDFEGGNLCARMVWNFFSISQQHVFSEYFSGNKSLTFVCQCVHIEVGVMAREFCHQCMEQWVESFLCTCGDGKNRGRGGL